ncbi:MAG: hypothetical protein ACREBG_16470 [Pyrinomonadaceae bacterium]
MKSNMLQLICLLGILVSSVGTLGCSSRKELSFSSSPGERYTVRISQTRPFPGIERYVYFSAALGGEQLLESKLLYTGDALDSEFNSLYPEKSWLSESIFKIGRDEGVSTYSLQISNETGHRLKYLLIESYEDKIILLDVEPGAVINLPFRYVGRLSCQGETVDSRKRLGDAIELVGQAVSNSFKQFSIRVRDSEIRIEAAGLVLSRVTCCAVDRPDIYHE